MNRRERPDSIKSRFLRFIAVIFTSIIVVVIIGNMTSLTSLNRYRSTFDRYNRLDNFYRTVELMNSHFNDFLYSRSRDSYEVYVRRLGEAREHLDYLGDIQDERLVFRYGLLLNMLMTYEEQAAGLIEPDPNTDFQSEYDSFNRLRDLILDTYPQYSKLETQRLQDEQESILSVWNQQLLITFMLFTFMVVYTVLFSVRSIRGITEPIADLVNNINRVKVGEFEVTTIQSDSREIDILMESFAEMSMNLRNHIDQIREISVIEKRLIEQENENLRISTTLAETRLMALQGQMNPHFLFNTISTLSKLAYVEGAYDTSELMIRTASLLRYGLDMGAKTSNLGLEIKSIEDYFEIQRRRLGERVELEISYSHDLDDVKIPGMILQPLVENSLVHGVKDMIAGGHVLVSVRPVGDRVQILVEDNGVGIPESQIDVLNSGAEDHVSSKSLGLSNVRKRLALFYKGKAWFHIESETACGAVVTVEVPI